MAAQVIIQLVADPTGLQPGIQGMEQLQQVDQQAAQQAQATNRAFSQRAPAVNAAATATQRLNQATATLAQSITGGAINQAAANIERISRNTQQATQDTRNYNRAIQEAQQRLQSLSQGSTEFDRVSSEIQAAQTAMSGFGNEATSTRGKLRQLREVLAQLEEAGLEGTQVFRDLQVEAGALADQVGDTQARINALASDTFELDATIGVIQGVAGAFAVAQGAAALFGDENEDVQKALLKVNAAMSILSGLQQIQNLLQSQSVATLFVENQLRRISAASIALQSAAESRFTIVRAAATLAQRALNAAMAANPATVLFGVITLLAGAVLAFTNNTEDATKAQEALNKAQEDSIAALNTQIELHEQLRNSRAGGLTQLKQEADDLKILGATRSEVLAAERKVLQAEIDNAKVRKESLIGSDKEYTEALKLESSKREELRKKDLELQEEYKNETFKNATALADAAVAQARKGSAAESAARIAAIQARVREELAAEGLLAGERIKIVAQAEAEIRQIQLDSLKASLDDRLATLKSNALMQRDGVLKLEAETAVLLLQAEKDSLGKSKAERELIEVQTGEAIRELRAKLFGDLQRTDKQEVDYFGKKQKEQVLASAQAAQERLGIKQQEAQKSIEITESQLEREKELRKQARDIAIDGLSQFFSIGSQMAIDRAQATADAEQGILKDKLDRGLVTQKEYDNQAKIIKRKQAQAEKQQAIFQAFLATAVAIARALPNIPLSVLAGALGAAEIAAISSRPIPAYKKGTKNAPGGPSLVAEAGPELIYQAGAWQYVNKATVLDLQKGAKVIPALETAKIMQRFDIPIPNVQYNTNTSVGGTKIDYNKLGYVIGQEISKIPVNVQGFDKYGPYEYTTTIANRHKYIKNRFGTR